LIGRLHRERVEAGAGIVLLTGCVSVEMVQKAAVAGADPGRHLGTDRAGP
jgi:formate dehydrogenase assembly factor FdhD